MDDAPASTIVAAGLPAALVASLSARLERCDVLTASDDGQLREWTMARLAWHKAEGHCCVIVSASPDVYLKRVAAQLGFDGLVCTQMGVNGGRLTGAMQTPNCHGEQKMLRLSAWLTGRFGEPALASLTLYAYGDTSGDKPMLRMARHAWYRSKPWSTEKL